MSDDAWARQVLARLVARAVWSPDVRDHGIEAMVPEVLTAQRWSALVSAAISERVLPSLAAAALDGVLPATDAQRDRVDDLWTDRMRHCLRVEARLVWLVERMSGRGVELRVLKGPAAAHLDHARPVDRQFADLDVLVRGDDMAALVACLVGEGFVRRYPEPRPGFDRRFTKSVSFRGEVEIDVHRIIAEGPVGHRIPVEELWRDERHFVVAGTGAAALGDEARFVHACLHSHLAPPPMRLSSMSDVARGVRPGALDLEGVWDLAERWRLRPVVEAAVVGVLGELGRPPGIDPRWFEQRGAGMVEALLIESHRQRQVSSAVRAALSTATLPGGRLPYLWALLVPQRSYRGTRGGLLTRVGRLARQVRSSAGGSSRAVGAPADGRP